jgi:translation elongation factor EF-Tu-like GTPase
MVMPGDNATLGIELITDGVLEKGMTSLSSSYQ